MQDKKEIIETALAALQRQTGLLSEFEQNQAENICKGDGFVSIHWGNENKRFIVYMKAGLKEADWVQSLLSNVPTEERILFITDYVPPKQASRLRGKSIFFIDTAGNGYINDSPLFFSATGNKPEKICQRDKPRRAFNASGLKVVYMLLTSPGLEKKPYREIAATAGVALGTVNWVISDLRALGYLVEQGKRGRRMFRKEELLRRWVTAYPEQMRPKHVLGRYRADDQLWWQKTEIMDYGAFWGGEVAAAKMTGYLKPGRVTVYAPQLPDRLLLDHRLRKDKTGDVEIMQQFWPSEKNGKDEVVHPVLVYADLLADGFERGLEAAKLIWEQELAGFVGKD